MIPKLIGLAKLVGLMALYIAIGLGLILVALKLENWRLG